MAGKVFFDANVILDFSVRNNNNPKAFKKLFSLIENESIKGIAIISIIQTCTYYMLQYVGFERTKKLLYLLVPQFNIIEGQKNHIIEALNSNQKTLMTQFITTLPWNMAWML